MANSIDTQWRCLCLSCRRTFIIYTESPPVTVCPGCRRKFGNVERTYDYDYPHWAHKRSRRKKGDKVSDTYLKETAEYCIVPWIRNPQPKIIPDAKFHSWYEDMKARLRNG